MATRKKTAAAESDMQLRIGSLLAQVRCTDAQQCADDARTQLLAIGSPAVPAILEAVRTAKGPGRLEMAKLLGGIADPASAPALVELLSDSDFDVRWAAIEGLSSLGYDALGPLISAIIKDPGSLLLRNGAHHVLHHVAGEGYYTLLKPLMMAIEGPIPNVEVPATARKVQNELARV